MKKNTTIHVAKFDCYKSSRIMMQSGWEENSIFLHLGVSEQSVKLNFKNLLKVLDSSNSGDRFIFHAQSSLVYLLFSYALTFNRRETIKILYDIHDLNVIPVGWGYVSLRAYVMQLLEWVTLRVLKIKSMTVSAGIARLMSMKYNCEIPILVRNISTDIVRNQDMEKKSEGGKLIYFGTLDRVSEYFFLALAKQKLRIDLFGRFNYMDPPIFFEKYTCTETAKFNGTYNPKNLDFLLEYDFLYYNIPPPDANYRLAAPNKFFQALAHGLSILVPRGYNELRFIFGDIPGAIAVIDESSDIRGVLNRCVRNKSSDFSVKIKERLELMKSESRDNYKSL